MINETELDKLKRIVDDLLEREKEVLTKKDTVEPCHLYGYLGSNAFFYAIHAYYVEKDITKAKDLFNLHGKYKLKNSQLSSAESIIRIFWVGRTVICNVAISDNKGLIETFATHNYPIKYEIRGKKITTDFKSIVMQGDESIYSELMLNAMNKDLEKLQINLEIFRDITLTKKKNEKMKMDLNFYESLLTGKRENIENSIKSFLTPKEHKYRNQHDLFPKLISYPASGYIKMALLNGINIDIEHDFIPMDLLLSKPLENYSNIVELN